MHFQVAPGVRPLGGIMEGWAEHASELFHAGADEAGVFGHS